MYKILFISLWSFLVYNVIFFYRIYPFGHGCLNSSVGGLTQNNQPYFYIYLKFPRCIKIVIIIINTKSKENDSEVKKVYMWKLNSVEKK